MMTPHNRDFAGEKRQRRLPGVGDELGRAAAAAAAALVMLAACSDGGSGGGASGGTGGGAAGSGTGGSGPVAQGGLSINIGPSPAAPSGTKCTVPAHSAFIGSPPPDASTAGTRVIDGESGAVVGCIVGQSGGVYTLSAHASHGGVSFSIIGEVSAAGTGTGRVLHRNSTVLETLESPQATPCSISVEDPPLQVSSGRVWAKFSCPALVSAAQPVLFCQGDGYFIFENCGA